MVLVRAVQAHVHKRRRGAQHARQIGAAHDAISCGMALQQLEHFFAVPTLVAKFDSRAKPLGINFRKESSRSKSQAKCGCS
jgi:hypothetical protein